MKKLLAGLLIAAALVLLLMNACRRPYDDFVEAPPTDAVIAAAKDYLTTVMPVAKAETVDFTKAWVYRLKKGTVAVRFGLKGRDGATDFVMTAAAAGRHWEGNYVQIDNELRNERLCPVAITTISLDESVRKTVSLKNDVIANNGRVLAGSQPAIIVPPVIWNSFVYSLQTLYPQEYDNWYYQSDYAPPTSGGNAPVLYYDPYIADNVILDTSLTNNFPCVKKIIDTISQYGNLNQRAQVVLNEVFNIGKKIHLTLKVDWGLAGQTTDGYTISNNPGYTNSPDEPVDFTAAVYLNPDILKNGTKEYIAATIIHEAIHAYIDFKWAQYKNGNIDSATFASLFPIVYLRMGPGGYLNIVPTLQHNIMAEKYFNMMTSALYSIHNDSMSVVLKDSIYKAITWGGLFKTNAWRNYNPGDTCRIKAINLAAKDTGAVAPFVLTGAGNCTDTFNFTYKTMKLQLPCN
jgi:hypothetical protein